MKENRRAGPLRLAFLTVSALLGAGELPESALRPGAPVDLARFGSPLSGERSIGVEWENPREVGEVRLLLPAGAPSPPPEALRLEWWGGVWPKNGTGGWMRLDDPWNGEWVRAGARVLPGARPGELIFRLSPLARAEWKEAGDAAPAFRRTLKVRVASEGPALPAGSRLEALGSSTWREGSFDIETRFREDGSGAGRIEVANGSLLAIESLPEPRAAAVRETSWTARGPAGGWAGVRIRLLFAEAADPASNDLTRVTVRLGAAPGSSGFSFLPQDALREGSLDLPEPGALVSASAAGSTLPGDPRPTVKRWESSVRARVAARPERTLKAALAGIPRLSPPRWIPLGVPSARQEVVVGPLGDWSMWADSLPTPGRDSLRAPFRGKVLDALLDTRAEPRFDGGGREDVRRSLRDGWLPLVEVTWRTGPLRFLHSLAATTFFGDIAGDEGRRGDETVVLLTKLEVSNPSGSPQTANVSLRFSHPAPLALREDGTIAIDGPDGSVPPGLTAMRGQVSCGRPARGGKGDFTLEEGASPGASRVLRWRAPLAPGESRTLYFKAPYVDLLETREAERLSDMSFEEEVPRILNSWRRRLATGLAIEVPEPALNQFFAANLWHVLITTDRDPETGLYNQGVGTFSYRVFGNETVMVARWMDLRGEHREAERFLEPLLHFQGTEPLTGRFVSRDGVFHGAGAYTQGKYCMNHGFVLWGAAEHYFLSGDRAYLERVAPKLVRGAEFIIRERAATVSPPGAPRSPAHGLTPAGALEDVVEFQHWFATNGYFHLGLKRAAEALAAIGHPEAARLAREAELFRRDIETAAREAATRAAAVRLRDGRWIPYVPSRVFQWRHLTEGWIREALYSSLHLATAEVVPPADPLMTWMLDELEDNVFFSAESGYGVRDVDAQWFERGGMTLQPCLLDTPAVYLARDEVHAALRAFFNTYALSIYPDVQCFAEWAPEFGKGGGPVYKTSDESRFLTWLRQLLVFEDGERLWYARGAPREWLGDGKTVRIERAPTRFGQAGLVLRSEAGRGKITARLLVPDKHEPAEVWLRLRHPEGKRPLRVVDAAGRALPADRVAGEDVRIVPGGNRAEWMELTAEYEP